MRRKKIKDTWEDKVVKRITSWMWEWRAEAVKDVARKFGCHIHSSKKADTKEE